MNNEHFANFERDEIEKSIEIENASSHIEDVFMIAHEAKVDPTRTTQDAIKKGFLIYPLDKEGYEKRADNNDYFVTFSEQGRVEGFLMCYDRVFLEKLIESGEIGHEDGIVNYLSNKIDPNDNFLFGDQIVLSEENRTREAGTMLMEKIFSKMHTNGIHNMYVAILHGPTRNEVSINFVGRLGFNNVAEVTNSDGLVWGIYHAEVPLKE